MIIARSHPGEGYPQYLAILFTASILSIIWWISNCSWTISLYLLTDDCWEVTKRLLIGRHILCLKLPSSEWVDMSKHRLLWSPGLCANVSIIKLTMSISKDLYAPSIGDLPAGWLWGAFGPQHLCENPPSLSYDLLVSCIACCVVGGHLDPLLALFVKERYGTSRPGVPLETYGWIYGIKSWS